MIPYMMRQKWLLFLEVAVATSRAGCNVLLSFTMGDMTNAAVDHQIPVLIKASVLCVGCLIVLYGLQALEMYCRKKLSGRCLYNIKADLYRALTDRGVQAFHSSTDSYYLNMIQGDIDLLERDYFDAMWRAVNLTVQTVFCVAALITVSLKLFLIFALVSVVPQLASRCFKRPLQRAKDAFSAQNARCVQKGKEFIGGFDTILFFSKRDVFISRLLREDKSLEEKRQKRDVCDVLTSGGATTINMVAQIICMAAAAYFVAAGELRFGALTTSTQLLNFTFTPLNTVINCILSILSTRGLRDKFTALIDTPRVQGQGRFQDGDICFDRVTAGYGDRAVLRDFSCRLRRGGTYAIIGTSGAGKSTMARALIGSAQVQSGKILIGGTDVRAMSYEEIYRNILYVPQNTTLFEGTVLENISFFGEEESARENALRAALPEELLPAQAGGDRGQTLSGGEKTRIAVARALCSPAPILIFDEPASGLDPETAAEIEKLLHGIKGKTVLIITHNWQPSYLDQFDGVIKIGM